MNPIKFVTGKPAMLIGKSLVIADLHLGIEREFYKSGVKVPSQTGRVMKRIDGLIDISSPDRLIILGDVKHKVPGISMQELREIPEFLEHFSEKLKVEIVPGNHDPGIERFVPDSVKLHPTTGFKLQDFYLNHGHAWPGRDFLKCKHLVVGHQHPLVEFRDKLGYSFREPVWVMGKPEMENVAKKYKDVAAGAELPEVIIMPAFSGLSGGVAVNGKTDPGSMQNFIGPMINALDEETVKLYMLDGTYIGKLPEVMAKL